MVFVRNAADFSDTGAGLNNFQMPEIAANSAQRRCFAHVQTLDFSGLAL